MDSIDTRTARDHENPDPHELNRPVPKLLLALIAVLFGWAVFYIAKQAPGLGSSSTPQVERSPAAAGPRAG